MARETMASNEYSCQQSSLNSVESLRCAVYIAARVAIGYEAVQREKIKSLFYVYLLYNYINIDISKSIVTIIRT